MMQTLNCTATCCKFNEHEKCQKDCVQVVGDDAKISDETYCASFKDEKTGKR